MDIKQACKDLEKLKRIRLYNNYEEGAINRIAEIEGIIGDLYQEISVLRYNLENNVFNFSTRREIDTEIKKLEEYIEELDENT